MRHDLEKSGRRSIRLDGYDYGQSGAYFVTICTHNRVCLFGEVIDGRMRLNECGRIALNEWRLTPHVRPNVRLDAHVVMPNHVHGVVDIVRRSETDRERCRGVSQHAPTGETDELRTPSQTIGAIVRGFKGAATRRINRFRGAPGEPVWQRNYYEHIIRNRRSLERIRQYIEVNPARWHRNRNHPRRFT